MRFEIPRLLQEEQEALHDELRRATQMGGDVGDAARALARLQQAAERGGRTEVVEFARKLMLHARTEEPVMYPAALLAGKFVRRGLARRGSEVVAA